MLSLSGIAGSAFVGPHTVSPQRSRVVLSADPTLFASGAPRVSPFQPSMSASFEPEPRAVGDYQFDPLGLGTSETITPFREAEIKHGRLAMLAAIAWPLQEILHPILVDAARADGLGVRDGLAASAGKSPSLLNGGLDQWELAPALSLFVFVGAVLELQDIKARKQLGLKFNEWPTSDVPGCVRTPAQRLPEVPLSAPFDPLKICGGLSGEERRAFQEKELLNGRIAMLAVANYVAIEAAWQVPIVQFTPSLFRPLFLDPAFRLFLDGAFQSATMMGSVDGVAI